MLHLSSYSKLLLGLFVVVLIANGMYLTRIPGFLGDEGSEGHNVYELANHEKPWVSGERSYIGPLIDYARMPFMTVFGFSVLAMRLPMLLITLILFWIASGVFKKLFSETTALYLLAFFFCSPFYLLYQRIGWAITLNLFFAGLLVFLLLSSYKHKAVLAGLVAGLGLANHLLFLPALVAITTLLVLLHLKKLPGFVAQYWPALPGFMAGFGMQLAILVLFPEDQGQPGSIISLFMSRVSQLPSALPKLLSGYQYMFNYVGSAAPHTLSIIFLLLTSLGALAALVLPSYRRQAWVLLLGLVIHLTVLLLIIDRFTLRYFALFAIAWWLLAGIGIASLAQLTLKRWFVFQQVLPVSIAVLLTASTLIPVFTTFLKTGGSNEIMTTGDHQESANSLADIALLLTCLKNKGSLVSDSVHINDQLSYLALSQPFDLVGSASRANWSVAYRLPGQNIKPSEACPELKLFRVIERKPAPRPQ